MKKSISFFLSLCLYSININAQEYSRFLGVYSIQEICTSETNAYYHDTSDYIMEIKKSDVDTFDIQFFLVHLAFETIRAVVVNDNEFQIPVQEFENFDNTSIFVSGNGAIQNDSITINWKSGGSMGLFDCSCMGKRLVENSINENDTQFKIAKSYPMPLIERTTVEIDVPSDIINARMKIYNMNGKEVFNSEIEKRGLQSFNIDGKYLSSGYYTCLFLFDNKIEYCCKIIKK